MARKKWVTRQRFENVSVVDTADEGLGIGKCEDGRVVLVLRGVPGDIVDVEVVDKKKSMYVTRPDHFLQYSPDRTTPFCSHFGTCGGCKWQQMQYPAQARYKEKTVRDAIQRIGGMDPALVLPIIQAGATEYYRNKLEFTASDKRWLTKEEMDENNEITDRDGLGFHLPGSFDKVLDIEHCYLQPEPSNKIRLALKQYCREKGWAFANLKQKTGYLRNVIVRLTTTGQCMLVIIVGESREDRMQDIVSMLTSSFPEITSVYSCINTKVNDSIHDLDVKLEYGTPTITEVMDHVKFQIGPKSFFQTNSQQAARLYATAKEFADLKPNEHVYDLYCGVGSLGLYMADACKHVVGIEMIPEAIEDAKRNAALNTISNATFAAGQVELLMDPDFIQKHGTPDVVITDPPRAGMHPKVIETLLKANPNRIVYVSCNPSTQARDMKMLESGFTVVKVTPVDMFPHTHHIESVALLVRQ